MSGAIRPLQLVHHGGRGQSLVYELLYDGRFEPDEKSLMGLIDVNCLYDDEKLGQKQQKTAPSQGQVSPKLGGSQGSKNTDKASSNQPSNRKNKTTSKKAPLRKNNNTSYRSDSPPLAACSEC
ncbi:hypothetical protein MNBD_GAMMA06-205 [hydrothermal vent metagenome]|uniref:Uncharacterized protein n=1 Tax=hydrothermal vent metagenome TaxID=652676 RepID=A0A3B0WW77_9ZZZZ